MSVVLHPAPPPTARTDPADRIGHQDEGAGPGPRPRAAVRALPPYVAGRRARSATTAALAANESHHAPLPSVLRAVGETAGSLHRYPDPTCGELRDALAARLGVDAREIAVGPGSVGVFQQILATVCDAGDEVVFAWRSFEAYPLLAGIAGARSVRVPLRPDETHDLPAMAAAITPATRLIILCSPNNPTGTSIAAGELAAFLARVPSRVLVVLDEAYGEFVPGPSGKDREPIDAMAVFAAHRNVCVLRTFSKAYGLAGLRVGYAVAPAEIAAGLRATALPFGVSAPASRAALASLAATDELAARVAEVTAERARVVGRLREAGWTVPQSHGNFVFLRMAPPMLQAVLAAFDAADILVRAFPGDGVRITLGSRADDDRVLAVLADPTAFGSGR